MPTEQTTAELQAAWHTIAAAAIDRPAELLLAMLDQLVEVACGTNPALKDVMRLQFYRKVIAKLPRREGGEINLRGTGIDLYDPAGRATR